MALLNEPDLTRELVSSSTMLDQLTAKLRRKKLKFLTDKTLDDAFQSVGSFGDVKVITMISVPTVNGKHICPEFHMVNDSGSRVSDHIVRDSTGGVERGRATCKIDDQETKTSPPGYLDINTERNNIREANVNPFTVLRNLHDRQRLNSTTDYRQDYRHDYRQDGNTNEERSKRRNTLTKQDCNGSERTDGMSQNDLKQTRGRQRSFTIGHIKPDSSTNNGNRNAHQISLSKPRTPGDGSFGWRRARSMSPKSARWMLPQTDTAAAEDTGGASSGSELKRSHVGKDIGQVSSNGSNGIGVTSMSLSKNGTGKFENRTTNSMPQTGDIKLVKLRECVADAKISPSNGTPGDNPQTLSIKDSALNRKQKLALKRQRNRTLCTVSPMDHFNEHDKKVLAGSAKSTSASLDNIDKTGKAEETNGPEEDFKQTSMSPNVELTNRDQFVSHYCTLRRRRKERLQGSEITNATDTKKSHLSRMNGRHESIDKEQGNGIDSKESFDSLLKASGENDYRNTSKDVLENGRLFTADRNGDTVLTQNDSIQSNNKGHDMSTRKRLPSFREMLYS